MSPLVTAFVRFVRANPHYPAMFAKFAVMVIERGFKHYGADAICERMRWHTNIENVSDTFKVANAHRAGFARLFEIQHPQHAGFFRSHQSEFDAPEAQAALRALAAYLAGMRRGMTHRRPGPGSAWHAPARRVPRRAYIARKGVRHAR